MVNIKYSGRHSTNLIDDVISPAMLKRAAEDRTGINNFRPFEELGRNLRQAYSNPGNSVLKISIKQIFSTTAIDVSFKKSTLGAVTFVPPVSSFASIGYASNTNLSATLTNLFERLNGDLSRFFNKTALLVSVYLINPVMAFGASNKNRLFGKDYKLGQASPTYKGISLPMVIKTSLVVAAIGFSSVLFFRGLTDTNIAPRTTTDSNGTTIIRNDSNRKPGTPPASSGLTTANQAKQNETNSTSQSPATNTSPATNQDTTPTSGSSLSPSSTAPATGSTDAQIAPSSVPTTSTIPSLPTVTPPVSAPTVPLIVDDPLLSQPLLP